jgi:hypothetical protein
MWDDARPSLYVVMFNPSTADETKDDPTINKVIGFAKRNGFGGIEVFNLFALRDSDPSQVLVEGIQPVGPLNNHKLASIPQNATVLCAWGGLKKPKDFSYPKINGQLKCLGTTLKTNQPKHPLYISGNRKFDDFTMPTL